jgi:hypothetical protein
MTKRINGLAPRESDDPFNPDTADRMERVHRGAVGALLDTIDGQLVEGHEGEVSILLRVNDTIYVFPPSDDGDERAKGVADGIYSALLHIDRKNRNGAKA